MLNVSTRRTLRTAIQVAAAVIAALVAVVPFLNMSGEKAAALGGSILAIAAAFTKLQTALEQAKVIPTVADPAKAPDAPPSVPAPAVTGPAAGGVTPLGAQPPTDGTAPTT